MYCSKRVDEMNRSNKICLLPWERYQPNYPTQKTVTIWDKLDFMVQLTLFFTHTISLE
jgi:hypothetical protein